MGEPLENLYFNWLCSKVQYVVNPTPSNTRYNLLRILHVTEFAWILSGDDNRAEDGKDLRREFLLAADIPDDIEWRKLLPCSILEMMIAFSRRAEFNTGDPYSEWFWEFIQNLGLSECTDAYNFSENDVLEILNTFVWRTYDPNGQGGMFPLRDPPRDQREVQVWYQFCDYLVDQDRLP
jgi:hypothetical protein